MSVGDFYISKDQLHTSCDFGDIPQCSTTYSTTSVSTTLAVCGPFTNCCWRESTFGRKLDCDTGFKAWCNSDTPCTYNTTICTCEPIDWQLYPSDLPRLPDWEISRDRSCGVSQLSTAHPSSITVSATWTYGEGITTEATPSDGIM